MDEAIINLSINTFKFNYIYTHYEIELVLTSPWRNVIAKLQSYELFLPFHISSSSLVSKISSLEHNLIDISIS